MRYQYPCIVTICIDIRGSRNGSSDPWSDEAYLRAYKWLKWRYAHWTCSRIDECEFDDCVKRMVKITIDDMGLLPCVMRDKQENDRLAKLSVGT